MKHNVETSLHAWATGTFVPMLRALADILDKGAAHARRNRIHARVLIDAKLAPDMYPLVRQVQLACDYANDAAARLGGAKAPTFTDDDATIADLKQRITKTIAHLTSVDERAFDGALTRIIEIPLPDAAFEMNGVQYLRDWALPHFYFHVVAAYAILRHSGVDIGKRDYASGVGVYIRPHKE